MTAALDRPLSLNRRILRIAGPAILANISGPLVGVVDTMALGHMADPRHLAAVAIGAFVFHFVYWSFGFLRMGTTGLVAQAYGASDQHRLMRVLMRSLLLALLVGGVMLIAREALFAGLFALLAPPEAMRELALAYCRIRIIAAPLILLRITVIGWLIGIQRTKWALMIELLLNISNAILTLYLVTGRGMGIEGAALASLISEAAAAVAALLLMFGMLSPRRLNAVFRGGTFWRAAGFLALLKVNGFLFVRTLFLLLAFALLWRESSALGALTLAVNQLLMQFLLLTSFGLDGIAYAAEALVGAAKGSRDRAALSRSVRATSLWAFAAALIYSLVFLPAGPWIVAFFTDIPELRAAAAPYLPWLVLMPVIAVWSYQMDGVFIGATETARMMLTMIMAFALYVLLLSLLAPAYGNHGLWAALMAFLAARGIGLFLCYPGLVRRATEGGARDGGS